MPSNTFLRKYKTWVCLVLGLFLSACQGGASVVPTVIPTDTSSVTAAPLSPPASTPAASSAHCTVISPRPTPGPTEASLFPPVTEQDWVAGPENARITLVEYSDFM